MFTLYSLFYKKKRKVEPEEILHDHLSVTQNSEYHPTNPPQDQLATHEIQVDEEERPHDEYKRMPDTESKTKLKLTQLQIHQLLQFIYLIGQEPNERVFRQNQALQTCTFQQGRQKIPSKIVQV